jgi:Cgr1 family
VHLLEGLAGCESINCRIILKHEPTSYIDILLYISANKDRVTLQLNVVEPPTTSETHKNIVRSLNRMKSPAVNPIPVDSQKSILNGDVVKLATVDRDVTKGRNVSGRSWKVRPQKRASTLVKTTMNNQVSTYTLRKERKRSLQEIAELQRELQEDRRQSKIAKKERKLENDRRRAENEFKQAQMAAQTLNPTKIGVTLKALSKKQLRQIKKTRVNPKTGVVEFVGAYAK